MTQTTEDIDFETISLKAGLKFEWDKSEVPWLGFDPDFQGDRVLIKSVTLDGPAFKAGLNAGDEILAINGLRMLKDRFNEHQKYLQVDQTYSITVSRLGHLTIRELNVGKTPQKLKAISVVDRTRLDSVLHPR